MALTPSDGNVVWGATDPDDGHVEFHSVANWLGLSAFRIVRVRTTQSAHTTALAQLLAMHSSRSATSVEDALTEIEASFTDTALRGARSAATGSILSRVEAAQAGLNRWWGGRRAARELLAALQQELRQALAEQADAA